MAASTAWRRPEGTRKDEVPDPIEGDNAAATMNSPDDNPIVLLSFSAMLTMDETTPLGVLLSTVVSVVKEQLLICGGGGGHPRSGRWLFSRRHPALDRIGRDRAGKHHHV
jgi:hypothetical protein